MISNQLASQVFSIVALNTTSFKVAYTLSNINQYIKEQVHHNGHVTGLTEDLPNITSIVIKKVDQILKSENRLPLFDDEKELLDQQVKKHIKETSVKHIKEYINEFMRTSFVSIIQEFNEERFKVEQFIESLPYAENFTTKLTIKNNRHHIQQSRKECLVDT